MRDSNPIVFGTESKRPSIVWAWHLERGPGGERYGCAYEAAATMLHAGAQATRRAYEAVRNARRGGTDLSAGLERSTLHLFVALDVAPRRRRPVRGRRPVVTGLSTFESLEQLAEVARLYAEVDRTTGDLAPVDSVAAERSRAREKLAVDWAARPRWALAQTLRLCAARLWLALEREMPADELFAQVEMQLPKARRVAGVMRVDTLAVCAGGELAKPVTDPSGRTTYAVALLVAGLERLAAPALVAEAKAGAA